MGSGGHVRHACGQAKQARLTRNLTSTPQKWVLEMKLLMRSGLVNLSGETPGNPESDRPVQGSKEGFGRSL